jgi:hypothetical protein
MRVPYVPRSQGNSNGRRKPDLPPTPGRKRYKSPNVGRSKPDLLPDLLAALKLEASTEECTDQESKDYS